MNDAAAAPAMRGFRYKHGDRPLDGYTIQRAAGRGGFGEVYYAISDGGREVALKAVQAYEQIELRGISQCMNLKSPHLVTIFDVRFGADGQPFVIMEFVNGPSLRDLLDQSPSGLGTQKAAFFLREIGKGLTFLHDCGIVHRDLKPGNIFYENGVVKIGDYGLSKAITAGHHSGQTVTVGTVHYMAPEIGAGKYDRGIDIYAMGALLYEMLTGQVPFFGASTAEVLMKHLTAPLPLEGIEEPFATVIRRAMAKDPAQRFQSVQEMVEAVYGAEHVRQSVSCFSPDSLTLVAGRVARHAGIGGGPEGSFTPSSVATGSAADPTLFDRLGQGFAAVGNRVAGVGQRLAAATANVTKKYVPGMKRPVMAEVPPPPPPPPPPKPARPQAARSAAWVDPIPWRQRFLLMLIATAAVSIGAGVLNPNPILSREPALGAFFVFLGATGAGFGIRWASRHWLANLRTESWLLRHLAIGAPGAVIGILAALLVGGPNDRDFRPLGQTIGAICVAMLIVDWAWRTDPLRPERMSLSDIIYAGVAGLVASVMLQADVVLVIGIMAATCMAAQIGSPWNARGAGRRVVPIAADVPVIPVAVAGPPASAQRANPHASDAAKTHPQMEGHMSAVMASSLVPVPAQNDDGPSIFGRLFRFVCAVVASALLVAATFGSLTLAYDLPGVMAVGGFGPEVAREMTLEFGTSGWPAILRAMIAVGMFLVALISGTIFLLLRRAAGGIHMLRAAAGIFLALWAPFVLFTGVPALRPDVQMIPGGWSVTESYLNQIQPQFAIRAGIVAVAGVMLLIWPARRRTEKRQEIANVGKAS